MSKKPKEQPTFRSPSGRFFEWAAMVAESRKQPMVWWTPLYGVPPATVRAVRERRHTDLKHDDGRLEARQHSARIVDGKPIVDLQIRWVPNA